jgi:3-hydroxyacyl-CoA dehydrogenase
MGVGIATAVLMADRGHKVTLIDTKTRETGGENDALDRAHAEIEANLSLLDELGMLRGNVQALVENLGVTGMMEAGIAGCSSVFEALPAVVAIKQAF